MATIFTDSGTCLKSDMYDIIISKFIAAGWTNVSSNRTTDGDVMLSPGISGDRQLYIQLYPLDIGVAAYNPINVVITDAVYAAGHVKNTTNWIISIRLIGGYTPGDTGKSGTFLDKRVFTRVGLLNSDGNGINQSILINYDFYVDKDKMILHTKSSSFSSTKDQLIYMGLPSTLYTTVTKKRGVILMAACQTGLSASYMYLNDYPDDMIGFNGDWVPMIAMTLTLNKNANIAGNYFMGDIYGYNDTYGLVNKIDGLTSISQNNFISGDIATLGDNKYKMLDVRANWGVSMFPTGGVGIQIA